MHILVTGGAGFIGSHTVDGLLELGDEVTVLDALTPPVHPLGAAPRLPGGVRFLKGDVRERQVLREALEGVDAVFHLAAYQDYLPDLSTFFSVNSVGTALLYELIVNERLPVRKVIVASSQAVAGEGLYRCLTDGSFVPAQRAAKSLAEGTWNIPCPTCGDEAEWLPTPERVAKPHNQYALSKYSQELMALAFGERYDIPSVALRYSIVQGPRQSLYNAYSGVCRIFCLSYKEGRPPVAYEDGTAQRDYVNIHDVVDANLLVLRDPRADGCVFNVGGGTPYSVLDFGRIVAEVYGSSLSPRVTGEYRYGDTRHAVSDITALRALGWSPRAGPTQSVREYAAWLAERDVDGAKILRDAEAHMRKVNVLQRTSGSPHDAGSVGSQSKS